MIKILTIHKYKGKQKVALTDNEGVVYMGLYASRLKAKYKRGRFTSRVSRTDLKRLLRKGYGTSSSQGWKMEYYSNMYLRIGCCMFCDKNLKALLRWIKQ
jgi:hypothetical protein